MKALTLKEPWATAILNYGKNIENRTWKTNYRGEFLLHVSSSKITHADEKAFFDICGFLGIANPAFDTRYQGHIIAVLTLKDIVQNSISEWAAPGQYHWKIELVERLKKPIPCKGKLNLWDVSLEIENAVLTQLIPF